jgi:S-adenosylmethionine:tRNA ribosyltransferase-isomerase
MTRLELFDYDLPEDLIAQYPTDRRDGSRLLVIDRADGSLTDRHFSDLPDFLQEGDVLVLNDSRVLPARLLGVKRTTGAHIELFLLKRSEKTHDGRESWEVLAKPARRLKENDIVDFAEDFHARVLTKRDDGSLVVAFDFEGVFLEALERVGNVPLPPYIKRKAEPLDIRRYQTVYADETGSAAAPTAGLHFTEELLTTIRDKGVETAFVTLHVGLGTFRPVATDTIEQHRMHEEFYHIGDSTAATIDAAKREGRRVICVGTTSVRTLESAAVRAPTGDVTVAPGWGSTDIFIYPGGRGFLLTDALITNFHLPKSTLLMLVSALYDRERILEAYRHAITERYRFFSYGDAMLIL